MNTKLLHRLAWKEFRTLRAFLLTLLGAAVVLQGLASWIVGNFWAPQQMNFLVPIWIPVMFSLACASVAFAGEREDGTDQLLSRLAVPPLTLWSVKLAINVSGTVLLVIVLFPLAWAMGRLSLGGRWHVLLEVWRGDGPVTSMCFLALIWQVGFLAWGMFLSLLCRRVLTCVVLATVATVLTPLVMSPLLDLLPFKAAKYEPLEWTVRLVLIPGVLLLASAWLVQTWDEDRCPRFVERLLEAWRRVTAKSERLADSSRIVGQLSGGWRAIVRPLGLCWPDEWLPAWRRETRRLLWLEWRQARRVMMFVLAAFGIYAVCQGLFVAWGSVLVAKEFPFVMALVSFVFGAWSFQAQQLGQRFRDFAGHGASPTTMWFIKQGVWFAVTLLTLALLTPIATWLSGGRHFVYWQSEREDLWRALGYGLSCGELAHWFRDEQLQKESLGGVVSTSILAVGLCFAVGQLVSLLVARAVTVATVGFVLVALAFGWQQLSALAAIPPGLAVLPLIVGLLLASAARMTDWLEERNSMRGWLRVIAAGLVPSLVTLFGVPIYRVLEIPAASSLNLGRSDLESLTTATKNVSPGAKRGSEWWMRLAESIEGEPVFLRKVLVQKFPAIAPVEEEQATTPHHLGELHYEFVTWDKLQNRDWLTRNSGVVSEMLRLAPQLEDCAFDVDLFEGSDDQAANFRMKRLSQVAVLLKMSAQAAIADGNLDDGLRHFLVLLRLSEHMQQHAPFWSVHNGELLESATWSFLIQWARHPAQTGDSLRAALGRSANATPHPLLEALKKHVKLPPPPSQVVVEEYSATKQEIARHWREVGWPAAWLFWERQREEWLLDFSAAVAMEDMRQWVRDSRENWEGNDRLVIQSPVVHRPESRHRQLAGFLQDSTRHPNPYRQQNFIWWGYGATSQRANERGKAVAWRRGLIATLALRAFQLDHGRWPTQWDELIGSYLDRVPVDPWNGLPFELRPQGYPIEVTIFGSRIPANTPLFVSPGPYDCHLMPMVNRSADGKAAGSTKWVLTSPLLTEPSSPKDGESVFSLIAIPLSATKP